jgi:tRNA A37 methylthiotransferase MiaB
MSKSTKIRKTHWRDLPPSELADQILQIRRTAPHRHLSVQEWRTLDRMRRRHAALQKETDELNCHGVGRE